MEYKINTIYFFYYFGLCDIPLRSKIVFVFIIYIYSLQYNDSLIIFEIKIFNYHYYNHNRYNY